MPARRPKRRARAAGSALQTGVLLSLAASELACSRGGSPEAPAATVVVAQTAASVETAPPDPPAVIEKLRPYALVHPRAARAVLYTWTTREQLEELRRDRVLLTRTESHGRGPSFFDRVVAERAARGEPIAKILRTAAFARERYAWPAPWATLLGWSEETYGDVLLRIELAPTAWIAKLSTSKPGWEVVDLADHPVPEQDALAHPERIAAVYFVNDLHGTGRRDTYNGPESGRASYREFVICNESMVASWSAGTDEIAAELEAEASALSALAHHRERRPPKREHMDTWSRRVIGVVWPGGDPLESAESLYDASLAFPNDIYNPPDRSAASLAAKLRAMPRPAPITHRPTAVFPASSASAPPLPPPPKKTPWRGTH